MNVNGCKLNKMPLLLVAICCLNGLPVGDAQHVLVHQSPLQRQFVQPHVEYSPWSPIDLIDYPLDAKTNKVRSIQSSPLDIQSVPRGNRRNFETGAAENNKQQAVTASTFRPAYKRRTFATSSTPATTTTSARVEGRFKGYRRNATDNRPAATSRRPFAPRTTITATTPEGAIPSSTPNNSAPQRSPLKKPLTRGNFRPKEKGVDGAEAVKDDGDNYPEHFKQLLQQKNKEVNTQQNDKSVLKKPSKPFKPTERTPSSTRPIFPTRQNRFTPKATTSTSTTEAAASKQVVTVTPKRPLRTRPRPTEKTRVIIGSTLQEPPTARTTPTYATRSPVKHTEPEHLEELKQIDPPLREYFPRTSAIGPTGFKYSSRFRNTDIAGKTSNKVPSYQPTVPSITTTPALDLNDIDLERWREILPLAAELIYSDAEIMTQSPSQTVSIYEALAEILSKPTESLSFLNNKSTDRTLFSEAPISSTTAATSTSTTTSTTSTTTTTTSRVVTSTQAPTADGDEASKVSLTTPLRISPSSTASTGSSSLINNTITSTTPTTIRPSVSVNTSTASPHASPHTNPPLPPPPPSTTPHSTPRTTLPELTTETLIETETLDMQSTSIDEQFFPRDTTLFVSDAPATETTPIILTRNETNGKARAKSFHRTTRSPKNVTLETQITRLPRLDLMTRRISREREASGGEHSTPSIYPVYRPTFRMLATTVAMTTTEAPPTPPMTTTEFDYDRLTTTLSEVSNPAPFKQLPKSLSSPHIPASERVTPLKKYPLQRENERFAVLPNSTVVRLVLAADDLHLPHGILPNGTVVKMHRDGNLERVDDATASSLETIGLDPVALMRPRKSTTVGYLPIITSTTEHTKTENASHILELLAKYQNETDALVKSPNIFSLAKKNHHDESHHETPLEFDNELVIIDENPEETIKTAFQTEKTDPFEFPTTPLSIDSNSVSIFHNGHDISPSNANLSPTTTSSTKLPSDSFENEISFDDKGDFKGLTLEPVQTSTEKISTRVTSSFSSSFPASTTVFTTEKTTTEEPSTTTESVATTTTENFIDRNYKALQQLLGKTVSIFSTTARTTTEMPSTTPETTQTTTESTTLSTTPLTTQKTTQSSIVRTTPSTTQSSTIIRKAPTQSTTRYTKVITTSSSSSSTTPPTTVVASSPSTTSEAITSPTTTPSTRLPISTTHRFTPIEIPANLPTKSTSAAPKRKTPFSDADDLDFLRQLSQFVNRGLTTTKTPPPPPPPPPPSTTTTTPPPPPPPPSTTTTPPPPPPPPSTTTTPPPPPPSTTTTVRILPSTRRPTTHSDADDLNFLQNLREYAKIINLTTERTNLAQKILELAMNRTSKSYDSKQSANTNSEALRPAPFATTTTQSPVAVVSKMTDTQSNINMMSAIIEENQSGKAQARLTPQEIEKTKQMLEKDLVQYNKDLQLLSLLVGRPLTEKDVAKLAAANIGKPKATTPAQTSSTTTTTRQVTASTSPIPVFKPLTENEAKFLQALQQIQTTRSTTTSTTTTTTEQPPRITPSRSQEAILAELLREQGIGPGNINQAPIQKILLQLQAERLNRDVTTTIRPFSPMPPLRSQAPRRPIIDGLSWLWRTWQETAPGRPRQQQVQQQQQQQQVFAPSNDDLSFDDGGQGGGGFGGGTGLNYPSNESPLGPNGFLGAAIGVTRAVTRFLGVAFTGAGQVLQVALGGSSAATNNSPGLGLFGGSRL